MADLHRCRALVGWDRREWKVCAAHCTELLARLREGLSIGEALDAVRATVWADSMTDPGGGRISAEMADGKHANLTRIFRPGKANKNARWIEDWKAAGGPDPSPRRVNGRINHNGSFTPTGKYTAADIFEET